MGSNPQNLAWTVALQSTGFILSSASAEDKALRGRNRSTASSLTNGRPGHPPTWWPGGSAGLTFKAPSPTGAVSARRHERRKWALMTGRVGKSAAPNPAATLGTPDHFQNSEFPARHQLKRLPQLNGCVYSTSSFLAHSGQMPCDAFTPVCWVKCCSIVSHLCSASIFRHHAQTWRKDSR